MFEHFYLATHMHSADYAVAKWRSSVRPSVTRRYSVDTAEHISSLYLGNDAS